MPGPIYCRDAEGALLFGNDALELRFDRTSGCWLSLTDRRSGCEVIRNPERRPNLTVVSGGREVVTADIRNPADPPLAGEGQSGVPGLAGGDDGRLNLRRRLRRPDGLRL